MAEPSIEALARVAYVRAGERLNGPGDRRDADWPYLTARTRGYYAAMVAAVVLALADAGLIAGTADGDRLVKAALAEGEDEG